MTVEQGLIAIVGLLIAVVGFFLRYSLARIDETLKELVAKVGTQNGRLTKAESALGLMEETREILVKENDRRVSGLEGEVKAIWNALRLVIPK